MSNQGYIRFENTYKDMLDCIENWDEELSTSEQEYRKYMFIKMCEVVGMYADNVDEALDDFLRSNY